jgi:L-asparaginase II
VSIPSDYVPVAVTTRSGQNESVHFGAVVVLGPDGSVERAHGNPHALVYPRSSNKPMQAVAMVRAGLALSPELLALVCASHDGLSMHRDAALRILALAGLDAAALGNTADLPLDPDESERIIRDGGGPTPLQMNCSGKHSGMLATCVHNGWAHDASYLHPDHPLQRRITDTIVELSADGQAPIGVDGCGAPAHMMTLAGLARSFRAIAVGDAGDAGRQVHAAMTGHPEMVGGPSRDVTQLMQEVPGLMAKDGAEGVFAAALPDGRAIALKVSDGANRARPPLMVTALGWLGFDTTVLAERVAEPIRGHGQVVGTVRSLLV